LAPKTFWAGYATVCAQVFAKSDRAGLKILFCILLEQPLQINKKLLNAFYFL